MVIKIKQPLKITGFSIQEVLIMTVLNQIEKYIRPFLPQSMFEAIANRRSLQKYKAWPRPWPKDCRSNRDGINIFGYLDVSFGLGQAARSTAEILSGAGVPLKLFNFPYDEFMANLNSSQPHNPYSPYGVNILQINPQEIELLLKYFGPDYFMPRYNIGYWVWEQHPVPPVWKHACAYVNEIWVPSNYIRQAALAGGVKKKIRIIPHCIELPQLPSGDIREKFGIPRNADLLLVLFDMNSTAERKNPLGALKVIRKATADMQDVFVIVKVRKPNSNTDAMQKIKHALNGLPHVIISDELEKTELLGLIRSSSAYISLHRSEGFGLFIAEAMALGKPVVATAYSGNMDFMTTENSYPVNYKLIECQHNCPPYSKGYMWAEPDEKDAVRALRDVLLCPEKAARTGEKAREHMRLHFSASAIATRTRKALCEIGLACNADNK